MNGKGAKATQRLNGIRLARLTAGYTQTELAGKLGITPGAVSQWEQGTTKPGTKLLKPLAEILNTTVDKLLQDEVKVG